VNGEVVVLDGKSDRTYRVVVLVHLVLGLRKLLLHGFILQTCCNTLFPTHVNTALILSPRFGDPNAGDRTFSFLCPYGEFVREIRGQTNDVIQAVGVSCSDSSASPLYNGMSSLPTNSSSACDDGYNYFVVFLKQRVGLGADLSSRAAVIGFQSPCNDGTTAILLGTRSVDVTEIYNCPDYSVMVGISFDIANGVIVALEIVCQELPSTG